MLDYLVGALDHPEVAGVVEIGGPDILSYGDMMRAYARLRGLRRLMIPVPVLTPRLSSYWVNLISPVPAGIARPLIEGLRNEVVVQDPGPAAAFGLHPLSYVEALGRAIDRIDRARRRVHLVRRARRVGSGDPLVGHLPRGDDRRASGAGRRRAAGAGLRRGGASRRRCGLAVCERPLEDQGTRGSPGRRRRDAPRTPRPRPSPGRRRARLLAGGGGPPADPAPPAGGDEGPRPGVAPIRGDRRPRAAAVSSRRRSSSRRGCLVSSIGTRSTRCTA